MRAVKVEEWLSLVEIDKEEVDQNVLGATQISEANETEEEVNDVASESAQ